MLLPTLPTPQIVGLWKGPPHCLAASLTDVCDELKAEYEAEHENVTLTFSYGGSGALQAQIEEGAPADIFISP